MRTPRLLSRRAVRLALGILLAALALPAARAAGPEATVPVDQLDLAVNALLQEGPDLDFRARVERLARTVARTHDFERMGAARLGRAWDTLADASRKALKDLLFKRRLSEYALRFDGASPLTLVRGAVSDLPGGGALVESRADGEIVLAFVVVPGGDGWRIADVRWDGRDSAPEEQAEDQRTLGSGGVDALIAAWRARVPLPAAAPPAPTPREVVERLQDGILAVMKEAKTLGYRGRFDRFAPLVDETHHLPGIAELALGRHWDRLADAQRQRYVATFREASIARYAGRFDGFSGERFETTGDHLDGRTHVVESALVKSNGERVLFVWALRDVGGRWKILNITADGVSELATRKSEYQAILGRDGFDALIAKMREQIRRQETGSD